MNNIDRLREGLRERGLDAVLVTGEKDQRFVAGFPFTDGAVLVTKERAFLVTDSRYFEAASRAVDSAVTVVMYDRAKPLAQWLRALAVGESVRRLGAQEDSLSHSRFVEWERALGLQLEPAGELLRALRGAKTEQEIALMRQAQEISERALEEALALIRPGMTERELMAELVYRMLRHGSEGNSFDPIVVAGARTSMPHGVPGDNVIRAGDFVTMDFGCIKGGYCSDMTRTVAVGKPSDEMINVYDTVLRAQLAGIAAARAGIPGRDIDDAARRVIAEGGFGEHFGHGFGHGLGLDIHEPPNANPSGDTPMPEGAVCSAEPGIYLPGRFGVRIEDVMVLRRWGAELITRAPKTLLVL